MTTQSFPELQTVPNPYSGMLFLYLIMRFVFYFKLFLCPFFCMHGLKVTHLSMTHFGCPHAQSEVHKACSALKQAVLSSTIQVSFYMMETLLQYETSLWAYYSILLTCSAVPGSGLVFNYIQSCKVSPATSSTQYRLQQPTSPRGEGRICE